MKSGMDVQKLCISTIAALAFAFFPAFPAGLPLLATPPVLVALVVDLGAVVVAGAMVEVVARVNARIKQLSVREAMSAIDTEGTID
jgi:multidrug efflux pump subunit AcrA (membrane-fusion protein)